MTFCRHNKLTACFMTIVVLAMVLSACSRYSDKKIPEGAIKIYCTDKDRSELVWEYYKPVQKPGNAQITEVLKRFAETPSNASYISAMPETLKIESYYFGQSGQLVLMFNDEYNKMDRLNEILLRTCLVKTLCQLSHIDYIEFYIGGQQLMLSADKPVGMMASEDFIDNTGGTAMFRQSVNVNVYFADETGTMLKESHLIVESNGLKSQSQLAIEQLINGPLDSQTGLFPVIPEGTALNKVNVRDGIAYVDFNANFLNGVEGVSSETVIYSVVNTLADIPSIIKVQFTIDGQSVKEYDEIPFSGLFERRPDLIMTEKAGEVTE